MINRMFPAVCLGVALIASSPVVHGGLLGLTSSSTEETTQQELQPGDVLPGRYILTLDPQLPELLGLADLQAGVESLLLAVGGGEGTSFIYTAPH